MNYYSNINHRIFNYWESEIKKIDPAFSIDLTDRDIISYIHKRLDPFTCPGLVRNNSGYVWLDHQTLVNEMPYLDIKIIRIRKRLKDLIDSGLLIREEQCQQRECRAVSKKVFYGIAPIYDKIENYFDRLDEIEKSPLLSEDEKKAKLAELVLPQVTLPEKKSVHISRGEKGRFGVNICTPSRMVENDHTATVENDHCERSNLTINQYIKDHVSIDPKIIDDPPAPSQGSVADSGNPLLLPTFSPFEDVKKPVKTATVIDFPRVSKKVYTPDENSAWIDDPEEIREREQKKRLLEQQARHLLDRQFLDEESAGIG